MPEADLYAAIDFGEKEDDLARKLRGVLVAEAEELRGLWTRDLENIYAFITRRIEKWTPKYKEYSTTFKRRTFFIGSTNDDQPLSKDGRRWLPVRIGARAGRSDTDARVDLIIRDRDQLWAEALVLWQAGGVLWEEAKREADKVRGDYVHEHPWEAPVRDYLTELGEGVLVRSAEILRFALGLSGRVNPSDARQLSAVMRNLGYVTYRNNTFRGWRKKE